MRICKRCGKNILKNNYYGYCKYCRVLKLKNCIDCGQPIRLVSTKCPRCANKNRVVSEETKDKMRKNHADVKGKNHPMYGVRRYGVNSPGYKDGRTPFYQIIRNLPDSKQWRKQVFERDNYTCQECGDNKGGNLEAHHIISFSKLLDDFSMIIKGNFNQTKDNMIKLALKYKPFWDITNGTTLCKSCHKKTYCKEEG